MKQMPRSLSLCSPLLLVSPNTCLDSQENDPSYETHYGSAVLSAYSEVFLQRSLRIFPLQKGLDLAQLWSQINTPANNGADTIADHPSEGVILQSRESLAGPLLPDTLVVDLAWDWRLATVLVIPLSPQVLNQAIAYATLARHHRCPLKGFIFIATDEETWSDRWNLASVERVQHFTQSPLIGILPPYQSSLSRQNLAQFGSDFQLEYLCTP